MILNIVTNAMDAMTAVADRKLVLIAEIVEPGRIGVSIADSGPGIASEQLGGIFETFYSTKASGTGLGLSIAKTIVESNG